MNFPQNHCHLRRLILRTTCAAVIALPGAARADDTKPNEFINRLSQQVLTTIKSDKQVQAGESTRIAALVDQIIMPHVNFERTTSLAVGRGWRQATPAQRAALTSEFRVLLVRTYARAMGEVQNLQIRMKRLRADPADTDVIVRSEIIGRDEPIELGYRLEKNGTSWKIYDLNVLGVWLVHTYRNQFKTIINKKGIDGLIDTLTTKNRQLAKNPK